MVEGGGWPESISFGEGQASLAAHPIPGDFFPIPGKFFPAETHRARTAETPGHAVKQCTAMPAGGAGDGNALYGLFMAVGK